MIIPGSFAAISDDWHTQLAFLYPQNEVNAMFRIVLEDVFGLSKSEQMAAKNTIQDDRIIDGLSTILNRLKSGEPLQHITGFTYFDDLKIYVSPDVLIPRPETEELVYEIVKSVPESFSGTIIDWCTGSGCIALALKNHFPAATVRGYDISQDALNMARKNAENLKLDVKFELKDALGQDTETAAIIVSNPPYIPQSELTRMHKNVTEFEPSLALFVPDSSPLLFYEAITQKAVSGVVKGGYLFFELHENYAVQTQEAVEATAMFEKVEIMCDLQGKRRMLKAKKQS